MVPADLRLRNATYRSFVELRRAPSAEEVATASGAALPEVLDDVGLDGAFWQLA